VDQIPQLTSDEPLQALNVKRASSHLTSGKPVWKLSTPARDGNCL
jgi:hypothetical protein